MYIYATLCRESIAVSRLCRFFTILGRAEGACLFPFAILPLTYGQEKSDQSGFLPILSLISCLLIYERQQRGNHATAIFLTAEKMAGRLIRPCQFGVKRIFMMMKKTGIGP
jgi:hypothetical protein